MRGAALALAVVVVLGPVVQPWYLLWFLPLFAATGLSLRELRVAVILTAAFTVHGMIESSTNADNLSDVGRHRHLRSWPSSSSASSCWPRPRERRLVLGPPDIAALAPGHR